MDPLSITASVSALLQLTGQIVSVCSAFISAVRDAPRDLQNIRAEIQGLEAVIRVLDLTSAQPVLREDGLDISLNACQLSLKELCGLLEYQTTPSSPQIDPSAKRARKLPTLAALAWPFKQNRAKAILADISRHKTTLSLV